MRCAILMILAAAVLAPAAHAGTGCAAPRASAAYAERIGRVVASGRDVWGEQLLRAPNGPTLAAARRFLPPLLYAAGRGGTRLTGSGVYYLPFTLPVSVGGSRGFGLHVADGSEIIVRRTGGPHLVVGVGAGGRERYGSCVRRLGAATLADGWLPILQVRYRDATGARYREESFVGRLPGDRKLVSFVQIHADAKDARTSTEIRLTSSTGTTLVRSIRPGETVEVVAAFLHSSARLVALDGDVYAGARSTVRAYWENELGPMASYTVPERAVADAEKAILVEELEMTWRYSVGNTYEELSYAEALDVAQVMAAYGCGDVARQILRYTLRMLPRRFTNWRAGERLVAGAQYYRLHGNRRFVAEELPSLAPIVARLAHAQASTGNGLLPRERYSSDIANAIYSLQGQTLVWQGLLAMSRVWSQTGHARVAAQARSVALRLGAALRRAVRASARRLPDGSLFVPASLLGGEPAFRRLTDSVPGTYWNLVTPYSLASGFFAPRSAQAEGILRYLRLHGSRLLGLVRAGAYRLAAGTAAVSGTDQVYGVNAARFLADDDQADDLVLSLYGTLAAALTPGTYVSGEAASVTPLHGERDRTMYLPPNNDGAASFLETLRLMLVHETRGPAGAPRGLQLAFSTPRGWLADGKSITVSNAPTSFGRISYTIARTGKAVRIVVDPPAAIPPRFELRLRLPRGERIVRVGGAWNRATGTIELPRSGGGEITLEATLS